MKRAAVILLPILFAGCALRLPALPSLHSTPPPAAVPAEPVCPGSLSADLQRQPLPTDDAYKGLSLVRPEMDTESAALQVFLNYMHDLAAWGRLGWSRAGDAKAFCDGGKP